MTIGIEKPEGVDYYFRSAEVESEWSKAMSSLITLAAGKLWELSLDGKNVNGKVSSLPLGSGGYWTNVDNASRSFPVEADEVRKIGFGNIKLHGH